MALKVTEIFTSIQGESSCAGLPCGGSEPIDVLPRQTHVIMDIKCPDSGMAERNLWSNIDHLKAGDEVKFVIGSQADFTWACHVIDDYRLHERTTLLMSPA